MVSNNIAYYYLRIPPFGVSLDVIHSLTVSVSMVRREVAKSIPDNVADANRSIVTALHEIVPWVWLTA